MLNKRTFLLLKLPVYYFVHQSVHLGLKSTPTEFQMTALLPSLVHHVCMDEMGHYIIAEKTSPNWQTTAFAGLLSDLILTMTKLHNYFGRRGSQWQRGVPKDGGGF